MKLFDTVASWATLGHMEELQVVSEDMLAISPTFEKGVCRDWCAHGRMEFENISLSMKDVHSHQLMLVYASIT